MFYRSGWLRCVLVNYVGQLLNWCLTLGVYYILYYTIISYSYYYYTYTYILYIIYYTIIYYTYLIISHTILFLLFLSHLLSFTSSSSYSPPFLPLQSFPSDLSSVLIPIYLLFLSFQSSPLLFSSSSYLSYNPPLLFLFSSSSFIL